MYFYITAVLVLMIKMNDCTVKYILCKLHCKPPSDYAKSFNFKYKIVG